MRGALVCGAIAGVVMLPIGWVLYALGAPIWFIWMVALLVGGLIGWFGAEATP